MCSQSLFMSLFQYKAWANEELFDELKELSEDHQLAVHTAVRILNHVHVVDRIFAAHLQGKEHGYRATNTEETPSLSDLSVAVRETDRWYLDYVNTLGRDELGQRIDFTFTDGKAGSMSREEILAHIVLHGGYHRGGVGRTVPQLSLAPPRDTLSCCLHDMEPERRAGSRSAKPSGI